ncbi:MAG TPA: protein kinase [Polyangiaceae bacterium]|jgi:hypothetical protein|nr:protein kinase [Polyangiaceae bacterium]
MPPERRPSELTAGTDDSIDTFLREAAAIADSGIEESLVRISLVPGELLADRFLVERLAGRGGMGAVYRCVDQTTGLPVALKVLTHSGTDSTRFVREAEVLASVQHPCVVPHVAHGLTPDGLPYLAMQWLEGIDLAQRLATRPLSIAEALAVATHAAQGLAACHALGVIHRDVKPSNLYLVGAAPDDVRVIDFGIARLPDALSKLTATGALLGTPAYMAPEQARGQSNLSPSVDVFALGCVLFECVAGSPPFVAPNANALLARLQMEAAPRLSSRRSDVPAALDALVSRMLAHDVADRFADAGDLAVALSALRAGGGSRSDRPVGSVVTNRVARAYGCLLVDGVGSESVGDAIEAMVTGFDGTVLHREAGRLVASFTVNPPARGDDNATRCALALRERDRSLRLGIMTGRGDPSALTAARVTSQIATPVERAAPGLIVVDAATASHLEGRYHVQKQGAVAVLGRPRTAEPESTVEFVGRHRELAALEGTFAEAVGESCARVALVLGDAGIGKSRLLAELLKRLSAHAPEATVLCAYADRPTSASPFAVVVQLVRRAEPIAPRSPEGTLHSAEPTGVEADFLDELVGSRRGDVLGSRRGAARRDAALMADALHSGWLAFVEARLRSGPLVLAIEDLHYTDPASLRMLAAALEAFAESPLFVIATARPEEAESALAVFDIHDPERVALKPLRANVAATVVHSLLRDASPEVVDRIVSRADGNPLRLIELARVGSENPATVAGLIEARLARLETFTQRVLRAASVFGLRFPFEGVLALLGGETRRADTEQALRRAEDHTFVVPFAGVRHGEGRGWAFRHHVVQAAAYATLDDHELRSAHGLIGGWLIEGGGADPSLVAWHFAKAGLRERAFEWYESAARAALRGRDLQQALRLADEAMACQPTGNELARVLLIRAEAAFHRGETGDGREAASSAMGAAAPGSATWTDAAALLITSAGQSGDNAHVVRLAALLRDAVPEPDARAQRIVCLCRASTQLFASGDRSSSLALVEEAERTDVADPLARAWTARARAAFFIADHDYEAAIATQTAAVRWHAAAGDVRGESLARIVCASAALFVGDFAGASTDLDVAVAMARRVGADYFVRWAGYTRAKIVALTGEPAVAHEHLDRVRHDLAGSPRIVAGAYIYDGLAALRDGDGASAESHARAALGAHDVPATRAVALAVLARALVMNGRHASALEAAEEAWMLLKTKGPIEENESVVYLARVEARLACGEEEAREDARIALARLEKIAAKLSPPRREGFLHGIESHVQTLRIAFRLGLEFPLR